MYQDRNASLRCWCAVELTAMAISESSIVSLAASGRIAEKADRGKMDQSRNPFAFRARGYDKESEDSNDIRVMKMCSPAKRLVQTDMFKDTSEMKRTCTVFSVPNGKTKSLYC